MTSPDPITQALRDLEDAIDGVSWIGASNLADADSDAEGDE